MKRMYEHCQNLPCSLHNLQTSEIHSSGLQLKNLIPESAPNAIKSELTAPFMFHLYLDLSMRKVYDRCQK